MIYRILKSPPGYPDGQQYMVAAYETMGFDSPSFFLTSNEGAKTVSSLNEARSMIPKEAKRLPFQPVEQFLELYSDSADGDP